MFVWGLADYPDTNVLLLFKTDAELTLAAYNAATSEGAYGVIAAQDTDAQKICLAGFSNLSLSQVKHLYTRASSDVSLSNRYLDVPVEAVISAFEWRLGLSMDQVAALLLQLAAADREGRFGAEYHILLAHGLDRVVQLFTDMLFVTTTEQNQRVVRFIRALAAKLASEVEQRGSVQPQFAVGVIKSWLAKRLLDYLFNALVSFLRGDRDLTIVRYFIKGERFQIDRGSLLELTIHWQNLRPWLLENIEHVANYPFPQRYFWQAYGSTLIATKEDWRLAVLGFLAGMGDPKFRDSVATYTVAIYHYRSVFGVRLPREVLHHLLDLVCFLDTANRPVNPKESWWRAVGATVVEPTTHLVLVRDEIRSNTRMREVNVTDVAVVNLTSVPEDADGYNRIFSWIHTAISRFREWEGQGAFTPWVDARGRRPGFDIAAVVFIGSTNSAEAQEIRQLADRIHEEVPFSYAWDGYVYSPDDGELLKDLAARAVVLVWKENDLVWFACIEVGPGRLSEAQKTRLVLSLAGEAVAPHQLREYRPGSTPTSGDAVPLDTAFLSPMVPIYTEAWLFPEEVYVPCSVSPSSGR